MCSVVSASLRPHGLHAVHQAPLSMKFSRQEYQSGLPFPPPEDLPDPGIEPVFPESPTLVGRFFYHRATWEAQRWCWGLWESKEKIISSSFSPSLSPACHLHLSIHSSKDINATLKTTIYDSASPLLGILPEKTIIQKDTCTPMFTAALFTTARIWKQFRCPLTDERIKIWYMYTMEYCSAAIKRNKIRSFVMTWMNLESVIQ